MFKSVTPPSKWGIASGLPVVTRPWPFLKHYMVYVKIRFKLRNLSVSSSSPPFVFSQTYSYSHDVHLSCHIKIIAKCAGEEEEQLLQVIFWKTPYMIVRKGFRGPFTPEGYHLVLVIHTCRSFEPSLHPRRTACSSEAIAEFFHTPRGP